MDQVISLVLERSYDCHVASNVARNQMNLLKKKTFRDVKFVVTG